MVAPSAEGGTPSYRESGGQPLELHTRGVPHGPKDDGSQRAAGVDHEALTDIDADMRGPRGVPHDVTAGGWVLKVPQRFPQRTKALLVGALVPELLTRMVNINPAKDVHILWFTFPAGINALTALVSFGVSGIYLSFLLTVIGSMIARSRGWEPEGAFRMGRWGWPVSILATSYLVVMLINVIAPTGLSSPRGALFNLDWITLVVVLAIVIVGGVYFLIARPDRNLAGHLSDQMEPTGAERHTA